MTVSIARNKNKCSVPIVYLDNDIYCFLIYINTLPYMVHLYQLKYFSIYNFNEFVLCTLKFIYTLIINYLYRLCLTIMACC